MNGVRFIRIKIDSPFRGVVRTPDWVTIILHPKHGALVAEHYES